MEMTRTKAIVAAIGTFIEALKLLLLDNVLEMNEWGSLITSVIILGATVYGVFRIPNNVVPAVPVQPDTREG